MPKIKSDSSCICTFMHSKIHGRVVDKNKSNLVIVAAHAVLIQMLLFLNWVYKCFRFTVLYSVLNAMTHITAEPWTHRWLTLAQESQSLLFLTYESVGGWDNDNLLVSHTANLKNNNQKQFSQKVCRIKVHAGVRARISLICPVYSLTLLVFSIYLA